MWYEFHALHAMQIISLQSPDIITKELESLIGAHYLLDSFT